MSRDMTGAKKGEDVGEQKGIEETVGGRWVNCARLGILGCSNAKGRAAS